MVIEITIADIRKSFQKGVKLLKLGEDGTINPQEAANGAANTVASALDAITSGNVTV